jgi:hypothetical protein
MQRPPYRVYGLVPSATAPLIGANIALEIDRSCRVLDRYDAIMKHPRAAGAGARRHRFLGLEDVEKGTSSGRLSQERRLPGMLRRSR